MKKYLRAFAALLGCTLMLCIQAKAAEATLQEILNGITVNPAGISSVNVATDKVVNDSFWRLDSSGGAAVQMIIELANNADINTFGIYQGSTFVPVFAGAATAGTKASIFIGAAGDVSIFNVGPGAQAPIVLPAGTFTGNLFGFFMKNDQATFLSDDANNPDGNVDHMWAFKGKGDIIQLPDSLPGHWTGDEYILAWEDSFGGGDFDHNDMVLMIESVNNGVPDGGSTLMLLGSVLATAGILVRRIRK